MYSGYISSSVEYPEEDRLIMWKVVSNQNWGGADVSWFFRRLEVELALLALTHAPLELP